MRLTCSGEESVADVGAGLNVRRSNETTFDVTVVMPVRDAARTLPSSLRALAEQETTCRWELIVVDDGSRDASREVIDSWLPRFRWARRADNSRSPGAAGARNTGICAARGAVIAFCDADDVVGPTWVQGAFDTARDGGAFSGTCRELRDPFDADSPVLNPTGTFHNAFGAAFRTCNAAVNASTLRAVGGFDESLGRYGHEDSELCARLTEAGFPIRSAPAMVVYFRETTRRRDQLRKVWMQANAEYVYWARHPDRFEPMLQTPLHVHQVVGLVPWYVQQVARREPVRWEAAARDAVTRVGRLRAALRWSRAGAVPPPALLEACGDVPVRRLRRDESTRGR